MKTTSTWIRTKALTLFIAFALMSGIGFAQTTCGGKALQGANTGKSNDCGISDSQVTDFLFQKGFKVVSVSPSNDGSCNRIADLTDGTTLIVVIDAGGIEGFIETTDSNL